MVRNWLSELRKSLVWSCAALVGAAGVSRAQNPLPAEPTPAAPASAAAPDDLKAQVQAQQKKIEELENLIRSGQLRPAGAEAADPKDGDAPPKPLTDADVKKIVEGYLKENPGAGVPSGVSTGLDVNKGFYIRSTPDPKWDNWDDQSKIPFELRIRGRVPAGLLLLRSDRQLQPPDPVLPDHHGRQHLRPHQRPDFADLVAGRSQAHAPRLRGHGV